MTITSISEDIKKEVKRCIDKGIEAVNKYGSNCIELNIDYSNEDDFKGVIMFHSRHNSFSICELDVDLNNDEIKDYVMKEFEEAEIDICEN